MSPQHNCKLATPKKQAFSRACCRLLESANPDVAGAGGGSERQGRGQRAAADGRQPEQPGGGGGAGAQHEAAARRFAAQKLTKAPPCKAHRVFQKCYFVHFAARYSEKKKKISGNFTTLDIVRFWISVCATCQDLLIRNDNNTFCNITY